MVLDPHGQCLTSREISAKIAQWQEEARDVAFLIGGADGHDQSLLDQADFHWSLGPLTLQHELALVVMLEQLYRARTILAGHPYHRDLLRPCLYPRKPLGPRGCLPLSFASFFTT